MDIVNVWLQSGLPASIRTLKLLPKPHPRYPEIAWREEGRQGECYYLVQSGNQRSWMLKKFHSGMGLERNHTQGVRTLLPSGIAFQAGVKRALLSSKDVKSEDKTYYSPELSQWIEDCILMPKMPGVTWTRVSDEIRKGGYDLSLEHRVMFAKDLVSAISELEENGCSHRDLSAKNLLIDPQEYVVYLVDWDSLYNASLSLPRNTVPGTEGYLPPWIQDKAGKIDIRKTWKPNADRFAMAVLLVEILTTNTQSKSYHEGSLFSQEILNTLQHSELQEALETLQKMYPELGDLWERVLRAKSYDECPKPYEWKDALDRIPLDQAYNEDNAESSAEEVESIEMSTDEDQTSKWNYVLLCCILLLPMLIWGIYSFTSHTDSALVSMSTPHGTIQSDATPPKTDITPTSSSYPNSAKKEYQIYAEYPWDDLQISIDSKIIAHTPKNWATVSIPPGEYDVILTFTAVSYNGKDHRKGERTQSVQKIRFEHNYTKLKIEINRETKIWTYTFLP